MTTPFITTDEAAKEGEAAIKGLLESSNLGDNTLTNTQVRFVQGPIKHCVVSATANFNGIEGAYTYKAYIDEEGRVVA